MGKYDDIIHLSRPQSGRRVKMPIHDRAAQFSPFAALVGFDDTIRETGRLTEEPRELDEGEKLLLDEKIRALLESPEERRWARFLCFSPDGRKAGGAYSTVEGQIRKVDVYSGQLLLADGRAIAMERIISVEEMEK